MIKSNNGEVNVKGNLPELMADACCAVRAVIDTIKEEDEFDDLVKAGAIADLHCRLRDLFNEYEENAEDANHTLAYVLMAVINEQLKNNTKEDKTEGK